MSRRTVLIVGGYGAFGARVAERLSGERELRLVLAGRSASAAGEAADTLRRTASAEVASAAVDALRPAMSELAGLAPAVIINASGPFQSQNYALAEAAITLGAHYIDLADARAFVTGIIALDDRAKAAGVLVASGASSVPAIAAALIDDELPNFTRLDAIHHGITPANGYDPGIATTASILGGIGKPMRVWHDGAWQTVHGWQGLWRYRFPGLGTRFMADCDVPDLDAFPQRYPSARSVRFSAGLEVPIFQLSLWLLAGAARAGLLPRPERLASPLMWLKRRLRFLGSDAGGMFIELTGLGLDGKPAKRTVVLIARNNEGPYVPAIASAILARKLVREELSTRGAMPCVGLITRAEVEAEIADLAITIETV